MRAGTHLNPTGEVIPVRSERLVVKHKPCAQGVRCVDILPYHTHQTIKIVGKEPFTVCCLAQAEERVVLPRSLTVNATRALCAKDILTLHADVSCFPLVALETECPLWKSDTVPGALAARVSCFETVVAKQLGTVLTAHKCSFLLALTADALL